MAKTILVDLDSIIVNLYPTWISQYNKLYLPKGKNKIQMEDMIHFNIVRNKNINKNIYKIIDSDGFFRYLPEINGAVSSVRKIQKAGHNVIICSSPSRNPGSWSDKIYWIEEHLGIKSSKNIILTGAKYQVMGDILIDDSPINAYNWLKTNPNGIVAQINWPYNTNSTAQIKANSWENTRAAWKEILENIL